MYSNTDEDGPSWHVDDNFESNSREVYVGVIARLISFRCSGTSSTRFFIPKERIH